MKIKFLIAAALCFATLPALAAQKDDDFKTAQAAANAGHIEDAARLFCSIAKQDPAYHGGEAAQNCKIYQDQINRENARNEERYTDGITFFNRGDYDGAEQKFRAIHTGPHLADAQDYLSSKIPAARKAAAAQGAEAAMNAKFDQGVQAFNNNAFSSAKGLFAQVTGGSHQADAQAYLQKMQQYEQFMQQGNAARDGKNFQGAIAAFQQAANIKGDGPGDPNGQMGLMRSMLAATPAPAQPQPAPVQAKPAVVANAVVESNKPKLNIAKLLREAQTAERRGDIGVARGKYLAILSQDSGNAQAQAGLDALPKDSNQKAGAEADVMLARGLREFYSGKYEDAEVHIGDYIGVNGGKTALAYFYRGVSKLTRYYLRGEQVSDKHFFSEAKEDFQKAKKSSGFKPPDNMVSPKIMKVFDETS